MIPVKNKKVLLEVTKATYKGNKKRNILTVIAIILTTFLITVVITLGASYWESLSTRQIRMSGMDFDIELSEPRENQVKKIRTMKLVSHAGLEVKCGIIENYYNHNKEVRLAKTRIYWLDETAWEKQSIPALEYVKGEYPQSVNEIMLSASAMDAMGIKKPTIGMPIQIEYVLLDGNDSSEYKYKKEFKLSGYYKDYSGIDQAYISKQYYQETGIKQTDFTQGKLKISLHNPIYFQQDIDNIIKKLQLDKHQYLSADSDTIVSFVKTILGLTAMLIMIFISGYLFVYNTLYISIRKDIHYYGQLKTVGMTSKQLKWIIYYQVLWNCMIGIPVGLLLGSLATIGIIPQIIHIANPEIARKDIVNVQPWIYLIAAIFSFLANIISSRKPALIVAHCSAVEAMKYLNHSNKKKVKSSHVSLKKMAIQNIFRDKKQAFIIFTSFVVALTIVQCVNVVVEENNAKSVLNKISSSDISFLNETMLDDSGPVDYLTLDKLNEVEGTKGVKDVGVVYSAQVMVPYQPNVFDSYLKNLYKSRYTPGHYEEDIEAYKNQNNPFLEEVRLIAINDVEFEKLRMEVDETLDKQAFMNGDYTIISNFFGNGKSEGMKGKTMTFKTSKDSLQSHSIKIEAVVEGRLNPGAFSAGYLPDMIVSEGYAKRIINEIVCEQFEVSYDEAFDKTTEMNVKNIFLTDKDITNESKLNRYDDMKKTETQVRILGHSIGIIMASLALLNYINMMVASIQNRSKEFATLESIGMTSKQLRNVLMQEGMWYALISIGLSLFTGIPLSYILFESMNSYQLTYVFPWISNMILIVIVFALCMLVPLIAYQKTQKESIIERLRDSGK